ncbi:MAG: hypothetical protein IJI27_08175 [Oscillospiraceae bacterium]|nr:hypothetical protein [Oscillospiraceae bacterium]
MIDKGYAYGMKLRGYSPGAQPHGQIDRIDDPYGKYYDVVIYDRQLLTDEVRRYDLEYIGVVERKWKFIGRATK